jgi:hypothetical protein
MSLNICHPQILHRPTFQRNPDSRVFGRSDAFRVNLAPLRLAPHTVLAVRPAGVALVLDGSHRRLVELSAV